MPFNFKKIFHVPLRQRISRKDGRGPLNPDTIQRPETPISPANTPTQQISTNDLLPIPSQIVADASPTPPPAALEESVSLLWLDWSLDKESLRALDDWKTEHPETTLDRILEKVCAGIEKGEPLMTLIPDSPFPARSLVTALAHLVKLGTVISTSKLGAQKFARDALHWVEQVASEFCKCEGKRFTAKTWDNLAEMRYLIDKVCKWALARLEDTGAKRIGHGLSMDNEIEEFNTQLQKAREHFVVLSVINLSQGLDAILQGQAGISRKIDAQNQADKQREYFAKVLYPCTNPNATYEYQDKRPCDDDTRVAILANITAWVDDISDDAQCLLWLSGAPGVGKSAITASVARECKDNKVLWAQYFINRDNVITTNPQTFFPSIARQISDRSRVVALAIQEVLEEQPSLMDDISDAQAEKLFVQAIRVAADIHPSKPVVVVFDALDETDIKKVKKTAEVFSKVTVHLPRNAKIFISSRTEDDIRKPFSAMFDAKRVKHIHLDTSDQTSTQDVSNFLRRNIAQIVEENGLDWSQWPGKQRMEMLCEQASGLFVWAVTAVKFIREQFDTSGREILGIVLDELNAKGMDDIDALYGTILRMTYQGQTDPWVFERFRRIVGSIVVLQEPLCLADLKQLLDLRRTISSDPADIEHFVRRFRTVLVDGTDAIDGKTVPRLHKSFYDFITGERAGNMRVSMPLSHGELVVRCLRLLADAGHLIRRVNHPTDVIKEIPYPSATIDDYMPGQVRYACRFWFLHLPQVRGVTAGVAVTGSLKLSELQELLHVEHPDNLGGVASFTISPDLKIVSAWNNAVRIWDGGAGQLIRSPLEGHIDRVTSVAFSPDSKVIASGSHDNTLRIWDATSDHPIGLPLQSHNSWVTSVAFSPDSKIIASGSHDNTIRMWDVASGQPIGLPLQGHSNRVTSVAFSPDSKIIVSGSTDKTIRIWDVASGQPIGLPLQGHTEWVTSVAFSPDPKMIASGSMDKTVRIWDVASGQPIGLPLQGHTRSVTSVAFSPDSKIIASGSRDKTVRIWDVASSQPVGLPLQGHTDWVTSVAFSSDLKVIASGSSDCTIRIWDVTSGQPIGLPLQGHTHRVMSVAFSPNSKIIASGCHDLTVGIWFAINSQPYSFRSMAEHLHNVTNCINNSASLEYVTANQSIQSPAPSDAFFSGSKESLSFSMEHGWSPGGDVVAEALLRWFPANDPNFGAWAYSDGIFLKRDGESVIMID